MSKNIDSPKEIRQGEELQIAILNTYLQANVDGFENIISVKQFPSGFSNLTYFIDTNLGEMVLRRPPFGASIKSAHDMGREYKVLQMLQAADYHRIPTPIVYCQDDSVLGAEFYLMERVQGVILRNTPPKNLELTKDVIRGITEGFIDNLVDLHSLDIHKTGLINIGKPEGYVNRQVTGWAKRYEKAATDEVKDMIDTAEWLLANMPEDTAPAFIHNDYKYDNVVLNADNLSEVKAVLDWEMATVGDPLMDLGTTVGYWAEVQDGPALKSFGLTATLGNYTRQEVLQRYSDKTGRDVSNFLFYYVFASFKLGVIIQQIYARYKKGFTKDARFAMLHFVVQACGHNAQQAIKYNRISDWR